MLYLLKIHFFAGVVVNLKWRASCKKDGICVLTVRTVEKKRKHNDNQFADILYISFQKTKQRNPRKVLLQQVRNYYFFKLLWQFF